MGLCKALGKKELKELGCNFIVVNVPVFATLPDSKKVNKMEIKQFNTLEEVKQYVSSNMPLAIFDQTSIYKEKADLKTKDNKGGYFIRCCKVPSNEFEILKSNLKDTETMIFSYKIDFDCWFSGKVN